MSRVTSIQRHNSIPLNSRRRRAIALAGISLLAVIILIYITLGSVFPASVKISPADGSKEVPLDQQLKISTSWLRGSIKSVTVKETSLDPAGSSTGEKNIDGHLQDGVFLTSGGPMQLHSNCRYDVTVSAELTSLTFTGPHHNQVTDHFSFTTITTPAPIFSQNVQVVPMGQPIIVDFNTPIKSFSYQLSPDIKSSSRIDNKNPARVYIDLNIPYQQGEKFDLTITSATGKNGVQMPHSYTQKVSTTEPLKVEFVPGDGEAAVAPGEQPTLTFSEDIKNQDAVKDLISIDPATPGSWTWVKPNRLEFKPDQDWTEGSKVTIKLKGGQDALRGVSGSFLREDVQSTFTVQPSKLIDVNLTEQKVRAYDNNQLVRTLICSSGSQATPSLTGTYTVYAKADKVNMSGPGYNAPNVPWVLMFNGDYTIHGNYWATRFGVPTSHGCVGLPVPDAHWLWDWAPIGTVVRIHY